MRNTVAGLSVFFTTFAIGILLGFPELSNFQSSIPVVPIPPVAQTPVANAANSLDSDIQSSNLAELDWFENNEHKFKIKLLELGEGFHGDQVNAKSGESWTGLFRQDNRYFLLTTRIKILPSHDPIVDDDETIMTGKSVATQTDLPAVFLLKNAGKLSEGEVPTLFYADPSDDASYESRSLKNATIREFDFNGSHYVLRVTNQLSREEFLAKGSKLVLTRDGQEQVLRYLKDGCNDCSWSLNWVGDLDSDGKLDFYFDLTSHYNISDRRLFLSSKAKPTELIRYVANFWTNGC